MSSFYWNVKYVKPEGVPLRDNKETHTFLNLDVNGRVPAKMNRCAHVPAQSDFLLNLSSPNFLAHRK